MKRGKWSFWKIIKNKPFISAFLFLIIVSIVAISIVLFCNDPQNTTLYISIFALATSGISFIFSIIVPIMKRPILYTKIEKTSVFSKSQQDEIPSSFFHRIAIINDGLVPAENCFVKLIEVRNINGERIKKFDPLPLYWTHQNKNTEFRPVTIFGRGDFAFLDILQEKEILEDGKCNRLNHLKEGFANPSPTDLAMLLRASNADSGIYPVIRVYLPEPEKFPYSDEISSPGNKPILIPGIYFLLIGIYAGNGFSKPEWFKLDITLSSHEEVEDGGDTKVSLAKAKRKDLPRKNKV